MTRIRYKIAILYSELAAYTLACLRTLKGNYNVDLLLYHWKPAVDAPYRFGDMEIFSQVHERVGQTSTDIVQSLIKFKPDAIYVPGWMDKEYLQAARVYKRRGIPVISGLDGQWRNTLTQRFGSRIAGTHLKKYIDIFWVAGERQAHFAKKMGFTGDKLWYGLYSCDWDTYSRVYRERNGNLSKAFLYIGRYVPDKGIDSLLKAYEQYRKAVDNPWKLLCVGTGPMVSKIEQNTGVENLGFMQPDMLPSVMARAGAFIMPSLFEPWGVAIHEAVSAGLPVICSEACGAGVHLVQDSYNGYQFKTGDIKQLTYQMTKLSLLSASELKAMGSASFELSKQFTPQRWADTFIRGIDNFYTYRVSA